METPQAIAASIVGPIQWDSATHGFCRCPGEALHTHKTGPKHCEIHIDGAPTLHCFHSSCAGPVADANKRLRQALSTPNSGNAPGRVRSPNGPPTHKNDGSNNGRFGETALPVPPDPAAVQRKREREIAECLAERGPSLLEELRWPYEQILASSPRSVADLTPKQQFEAWTRLWPDGSIVWIGQVNQTGHPSNAIHFKPIELWRQSGPAGNFTCPAAFKPGTISRSDTNVETRHWLVVESDTLTKDQVGAVFLYMRSRLRYRLHCIIDTGGKSLHAWFSLPPHAYIRNLKAGLVALGCDPKMFGSSQPCRVPGVLREDKLQKLIWLRQ